MASTTSTKISFDFADNTIGTIILGASVAGGVLYGVSNHKGIGGTILYAALFGLSGAILSVIIANVSSSQIS